MQEVTFTGDSSNPISQHKMQDMKNAARLQDPCTQNKQNYLMNSGKFLKWEFYFFVCLSIEYYDSVKERLFNPYSSILS